MCMYAVGIPRTLSVMFCPCESDVVKLIKLNYWPATPTRPSIAFSFSLLDWLEALLLKCQVALHDATEAIAFLIKEEMECVCALHVHILYLVRFVVYCDVLPVVYLVYCTEYRCLASYTLS